MRNMGVFLIDLQVVEWCRELSNVTSSLLWECRRIWVLIAINGSFMVTVALLQCQDSQLDSPTTVLSNDARSPIPVLIQPACFTISLAETVEDIGQKLH